MLTLSAVEEHEARGEETRPTLTLSGGAAGDEERGDPADVDALRRRRAVTDSTDDPP
jgi:hypothetical protein